MLKNKKNILIGAGIIIIIIVTYLTFFNKDLPETFKIYYKDQYFTGELIYTEPMIDELISIPIISNKEITEIEITNVNGENIDKLTIEINSFSNQNYYYKDFIYKNIELRVKSYDVYQDIKINEIEFNIASSNKEQQIGLAVDLLLRYERDIFNMTNFGSLKMFSVAPNLSDPNQFFTIRPNHNMKIIDIDNNINNSIEAISVGISSSDDFNEINKTILEDYLGNELNIDVLKNYNVYFNIDYKFELNSYIGVVFPLLCKIELTNHENYNVLIMNAINLMIDHITIQKYIDNNFIEE